MRFTRWISEFVMSPIKGLRSAYRLNSGGFFRDAPAYDRTRVDYDLARQLYRNDGGDTVLGAGFCKPIIDRAVEFIGVPQVSSDNPDVDNEINTAIERYWKPQIVEMLRNSMRDSLTYVRVWQPLTDDPLTTDEERRACALRLYEPERVTLTYDPQNPNRVAQCVIVTEVEFPDDVQPDADPPRGSRPQTKTHKIWEVISPERYDYWDETENRWITEWSRANPDGFVPVLQAWNEYDSSLSGGQSDLESVYPFIKAFHEVMRQALQAHGYHSTPKLRFKVTDVISFLRANFPDTIDPETLTPIPGASIPWKNREVLFIGENEDIDFIEIKSVLGDSKTLLEFLIDCIAIASETPEWAFMRVESGAASQGNMNAQTVPFEKKIERKRAQYQPIIQRIVKMALKMQGNEPRVVDILWQEIRVENLVAMTQSMQQFTMTLEVLLERKLISENTAREALRQFRIFRTMRSPEREAQDAQDNLSLDERNAELDRQAAEAAAKATARNGNGVPAFSGRNGGGANE